MFPRYVLVIVSLYFFRNLKKGPFCTLWLRYAYTFLAFAQGYFILAAHILTVKQVLSLMSLGGANILLMQCPINFHRRHQGGVELGVGCKIQFGCHSEAATATHTRKVWYTVLGPGHKSENRTSVTLT